MRGFTEEQDTEARRKTLEELMGAMSGMTQKRLPGGGAAAPAAPVMIPPGALPPEGPGRDLGAGGGMAQPGSMDARLADLIKKKKSGMGA